MFKWIKKLFELDRTAGQDEKLAAISRKEEAAEMIERQLGLTRIGGDRRGVIIPGFEPERRHGF